MKKILKMLLLVFFLLIFYIYILEIEMIPKEIVLFEGENISIKTMFGLNIKNKNLQTIETSSGNESNLSNKIGNTTLELNLFNNIPVKDIEVSVLPKTKVIPVGDIAGVKLYTNGVLVVRNVRDRRWRQIKA